MSPKVPALPITRHIDAPGPGEGQPDGGHGHQTLSGQGDHGDGDRYGAHGEDADHGGGQEDPIGGGVEHLAEVGYLVQTAGQLAVHPVGRAQGGEKDGGCEPVPVMRLDQQPDEHRHQDQARSW